MNTDIVVTKNLIDNIRHHKNKAVHMYNKGFVSTAASHKNVAVKLATKLNNPKILQIVLTELKVIK